jgi:hypothetical protein
MAAATPGIFRQKPPCAKHVPDQGEPAGCGGAGPLRVAADEFRPGGRFQLVQTRFDLAFINSFDEVTVSVSIATPRTENLPVRRFLYIQDNIDPLVTSVSAAVIAITVITVVALDRLYGLENLLIGKGQDGR